jgi:hypothetical protein
VPGQGQRSQQPEPEPEPHSRCRLEGKVVLDIGSRLGNNLYVGAIVTDAEELIGIEMNLFFAGLSKRLIADYSASPPAPLPASSPLAGTAAAAASEQAAVNSSGSNFDRISIVPEDIRDRTDLLDKADVVIFFNPFEQHFSRAEHQELLRLFRTHCCRPGVRLVSVPSMEDIYGRAGLHPEQIDVGAWLASVGAADDGDHGFGVFVYDVR